MVQIKICGVTSESDARASCEAGADAIGFNFYPRSPRYIGPDAAAQIRPLLPAHISAIGVFVNENPEEVINVCASLQLTAAQLHGDETPQVVNGITERLSVIKVFRVGANFDLSELNLYPQVFAFLIDTAHAGQYGGTGNTADWTIAQQAAQSRRIILAGGLKPENVAAAVQLVRPYGVDVASGVESQPGRKDPARLRDFIQEVRRAEGLLFAATENAPKS